VHALSTVKSFLVESKKPFFFLPSPPARFPPDETTENLFGTICFVSFLCLRLSFLRRELRGRAQREAKRFLAFYQKAFYGGQARTAVRYFLRTPMAYPCENNARATFYDMLAAFLMKRAKLGLLEVLGLLVRMLGDGDVTALPCFPGS
jgi:hypothetical protein